MATALAITEEMAEHDFVGEQGGPLKGGGTVGIGAAKRFVLAVGLADQSGVAELANDPAAATMRKEMFQFHTPPR